MIPRPAPGQRTDGDMNASSINAATANNNTLRKAIFMGKHAENLRRSIHPCAAHGRNRHGAVGQGAGADPGYQDRNRSEEKARAIFVIKSRYFDTSFPIGRIILPYLTSTHLYHDPPTARTQA